jgi:membrane fusion protein (multidrug efflux system)
LLTTVQQLDPIYIDLTQSSNEVLRIRRAMEAGKLKREGRNEAKVTLVLDDGSHYPLSGKLLFSDISVDATTSMVTLRAQFPNPNHLLLPGMYARALVEESASTQAILLPQRVVIRGENGQASVMIVNKDEVIEERKIKLGEARGDKWVVAEGLVGGERVIVEGLQKIAPGAKTKPSPYQSANEKSAEKSVEKPESSASPVAAPTKP